ncbi:MAG TPA: class I SAM-dependent methyltransferase [Actinomycetota bacterium]|nr:class I SAM-dependent methyltransferase [Actinomycetota bacterium]
MLGPRAIVRSGYDAIAPRYLRERLALVSEAERTFLRDVLDAVPPGAHVVDLGCGPGVPFTEALAEGRSVIGVDLSREQLRLARRAVPSARLVQGDMVTIAFRARSLDAVTAFASTGHVPSELHPRLYRSIASWLRPGGVFAAQLPTGANPEEFDDDWMGAPMYFSHPDLAGTLELLRDAGFVIDDVSEVGGQEHDGTESTWGGVIARVGP